MANSRDRRRLRRQLQEAGLGSLLKPIPSSPQQTPIPVWKKIPVAVYFLLGALALLITLLEGYPWLSLQKDDSLDSSNPYKTMFVVVNDGYVLLTDLDVGCTPAFTTDKHNTIGGFKFVSKHLAHSLWHSERATLPCFDTVHFGGERSLAGLGGFGLAPDEHILEASMTISVEYSFFDLNFTSFRRTQTFRVNALRGTDGSYHWQFLQ